MAGSSGVTDFMYLLSPFHILELDSKYKFTSNKTIYNFNDFPDIQYWLRRYSARSSKFGACIFNVGDDDLFLCIAVRRQPVKTGPVARRN